MLRSMSLGASVLVLAVVAGTHLAVAASTLPVRATPGHVIGDRLPAGALRSNGGTVLGSVWDERDVGVPNALVRLRNLGTGRLEGSVRADDKGQFTFEELAAGNYVLEYVNGQEKVLALGQHFTVQPGETIATFIRLGTRAPWFAGFFGNAAAGAVATAATLGITAVAPAGQPHSPER